MQPELNHPGVSAQTSRRADGRPRGQAPDADPGRAEPDTQQLIRELRRRQIELENQNGELRRARAELEARLQKCCELYAFAPVGYLTFDREGMIQEANLTAASLLGIDQSRLVRRRFELCVAAADRPAFAAFLARVFASQGRESCEVTLEREDRSAVGVRIEATVITQGGECRAVIEDRTEARRAEESLRRLNETLDQRVTERTLELEAANAALREAHDQVEQRVQRRTAELHAANIVLRLRESEVRTLVEHSQDLIARLDLDGQLLYVNPAMGALLGMQPQEMLGKRLRDLGLPESVWRPARETFYRVGATWREASVELTHTFGGVERCFEARCVPELGLDGSVASVLVVSREITESKQAEVRLRENARLFRAIFNSTFQSMALLRTDGTIIELNNSALQFAGRRLEDLRGLPFWEARWWTRSKQVQLELQQAIACAAAGEAVRYAVDVVGVGDRVRTIDFSLRPLRNEEGRAQLLIAEGHDITERKQAEQALREAGLRARALADAALEGIIIHDRGIIQEVNVATAVLFGWEPTELIGRSVLTCIDPASREAVRPSLLTNTPQHFETLGLKQDGQQVPVEVRSRRFPFRDHPVSVLAVRDLTEQKRNLERIRKLEQEEALKREAAARKSFTRQLLEAQEKERRRIATELHDGLGQNLLVIKQQAERGLAEPGKPPRVEESLTTVAELAALSVRDIRTIVQHLHPYLLERLGLTRALRAMVESVGRSSSTRFIFESENVDRTLTRESEIALYRVLQECVNNVVKHAHATVARVCIRREPERVCALVEDDGQGFDSANAVRDSAQTGFGLRGVFERIATRSGTAHVVTQPGGGTRIALEIPVTSGAGDSDA